jgi:hypothetical protein
MPVSLLPDSFVEGGGLWDNKDVRWTNPRFVSDWTYQGKMKATPAFVVSLVGLDDGEEIEQAWSVGSADDYKASVDGKKESREGDYLIGSALKKSSNFVILVNSIIDAIPADQKEDVMQKLLGANKASAFEGMEAHMVRQKVDRPGLVKAPRADGKVFDSTVPVVDVILKFPWDKKAPPGVKGKATAAKAAAKAPAKAAPAEAASDDLDQKAIMEIGQILAKNPDGMERTACSQEIFKAIKVPKERNLIVAKIYDPEWLEANAEDGGWVFDKESDTIAAA